MSEKGYFSQSHPAGGAAPWAVGRIVHTSELPMSVVGSTPPSPPIIPIFVITVKCLQDEAHSSSIARGALLNVTVAPPLGMNHHNTALLAL